MLQQAERHISEETFGNKEVAGPAMQSAEQDSNGTNYKNAWPKEPGRLFRRGPQVVCAPSDRLRCIPVAKKTGDQPNGENKPEIFVESLKPPDVQGDESAERESFD